MPGAGEGWFTSHPAPGQLPSTAARFIFACSLLEICCVLLDEVLFLRRQVVEGKDRIGSTDRDTGSTVDAAFGFHVHLRRSFELGLVLLGVDAVGGANIDAEGILDRYQ